MARIIPAPGGHPSPQHAAHADRITLTHADTAPDERIGGRSGATTWWRDGTTSYVLHFRSGQTHGWTMADETDTAIQAVDSLREDEDMSAGRLWSALRDVRRLRTRLEALEAELILYARETGEDGRPRMALREIGEATDRHHSSVAERVERMRAGEHAPWRNWLTQGTARADLYGGAADPASVPAHKRTPTACAACGHLFTPDDLPVTRDGHRIHASHTTDPLSGFCDPLPTEPTGAYCACADPDCPTPDGHYTHGQDPR